jgi:hypothetical protein
MRTNKNSRTRPSSSAAAVERSLKRLRPVEEDTQGLEVRDLLRRPAAFFGLSPHASDSAARLTRGSLAYRPI